MTVIVSQHVFFLGLGGIGMSSLARHLARQGHVVGGYDLTPSKLIDDLQAEGMFVTHSPMPEDLPEWALCATNNLTVVRTPACLLYTSPSPRDLG